ERLGALGLLVVVQQADVGELDRRPQGFVLRGLREILEELLDRLLHAAVVHLDTLARELAPLAPRGLLEQCLRGLRGLAEQAVVLVETGEDAARDVQREAGAAL